MARRVARAKPVLAVKAGRTSAGARAASSHTGALIAASDSTVDALFASAGVIRCDGLDDLLDAAGVLAEQGAPAGSRVGIVANARGPLVVLRRRVRRRRARGRQPPVAGRCHRRTSSPRPSKG